MNNELSTIRYLDAYYTRFIVRNQAKSKRHLTENPEPVWPLFGQNFPKIRFGSLGPRSKVGGLVVGYVLRGARAAIACTPVPAVADSKGRCAGTGAEMKE